MKSKPIVLMFLLSVGSLFATTHTVNSASSLTSLLNGGSVARLFDRFQLPRAFWPDTGLAIEVMPSTSPANAGVRASTVIATWAGALRTHLGRRLHAPAMRPR